MNEINHSISKLQHDTSEKIKLLNDTVAKKKLLDEEDKKYKEYTNEWHNLAKIYESIRLSGQNFSFIAES